MHVFEEQVKRIVSKLKEAKKIDTDLQVFGADEHKYTLDEPVSETDIVEFEQAYNISLPTCYTTFVTKIGNGGIGYKHSAAGPFLGIYPFKTSLNELAPPEYLSQPTRLFPHITEENWAEFLQPSLVEGLTDAQYTAEISAIYAGILPIGSQGCTYLHGLVLNGRHKGKVVNLDIDNDKPKFTYESNFLDWYERWLDEIISGDLLINTPNWFAYSIGGSAQTIIDTYFSSDINEVKIDCLSSLLYKKNIDHSIIQSIENEYLTAEKELKKVCLYILTKFDYDKAKPHLMHHAQTDLLTVFQSIFWYQKDKSAEWSTFIQNNLDKIEEGKTRDFCTYLLDEISKTNTDLLTFLAHHEDPELRKMADDSMQRSKDKQPHITTLTQELHDDSDAVVAIETDVAEAKTKVAEAKTDVVEEKTDVVEEKTNVVEEKTNVVEEKTDVEEVKTDVEEVKTDVEEVKTDIIEEKTDVVEEKTDVAEAKTEVAEAKTEVEEAKTEVEEAKTEVEEVKTDVEEVKIEQIESPKKTKKWYEIWK